jgi:hypothetical protein
MILLTPGIRRKLRLLKFLIPLGLVLLVIVYELGPSLWIYNSLGFSYHLLVEILIFGSVGPLLVFFLLEMLSRWIEEKETAELQANLLARAQEKELEVRQISDDTLQVLFAASLLITTIKSDQVDLSANTATHIQVTEEALQQVMQRVSSHLST